MATNFSRLPPLPTLKNFLYAYRLQAKKILSQNYLMDMNLTRKVRHVILAFINNKHKNCGNEVLLGIITFKLFM